MDSERRDAELSLIGALVAKPELLDESPPLVPEPGILSHMGQVVYETIVGCYDHHSAVDTVILRDALPSRDRDAAVQYVAEALDLVPMPSHARHYASILERRARRMEITNLAAALQEAVQEDDPQARLREHVEGLADLVEDVGTGEPMEPLDLVKVMNEEPEPVPWLIPGWLAERDCAMVAGEPGSGKSIFTLDMAIAIATGGEFLGTFRIPEQKRVLYLDEEMPPQLARRRLRQLITGRELEPEQIEMQYYNRQRVNLDRAESRLGLRRVIEDYRPAVVVLDSLVRFHSRDENSNTEMSAFHEILVDLAEEYSLTWLILHHLAKPSKDKSKQLGHRVRGASDLRAAMDQLYGLEGDSSTSMRMLTHDKNRWGDESLPVSMVYQENETRTSATLTGNTQTKDAEEVIVDLVYDAEGHGVARTTVIKTLDAAGYKAAARTATSVLGKLKGQGTLVSQQKGSRVRLWHKDHAPRELLPRPGLDI